MRPHLLALLTLSVLPDPASARVSPQLALCHDYATQRYIADFQQVGQTRKGQDEVVTTFRNHNPRYEDYVAECMKRLQHKKAR